jgi:DNA-binding NarL/FixJ family response regulator
VTASDADAVTTVLLVEDHLALAQGLRSMLSLEPDLDVVDVVGRADAAADAARTHQPHVAIVDLDLPGGGGQEAIGAMRDVSPDTRYLVLTALRDRLELAKAVEVGVSGLLHKSADVPEVLDHVRRVAAGENLVPPELTAHLLSELREARQQGWRAEVTRASLSPRETEVLAALAQGESVAAIAERLHLSPDTVETHLRNARSKLGVSSRLEAVVEALRLGLVDPPGDLPEIR